MYMSVKATFVQRLQTKLNIIQIAIALKQISPPGIYPIFIYDDIEFSIYGLLRFFNQYKYEI